MDEAVNILSLPWTFPEGSNFVPTNALINSSNGNLFVIDTYPNQFQERFLYTFDLKLNEFKILGSAFNNFYLTKEKKCDFHPKISNDNKIILIDTSHNLKREFIILER